MKNKTLSRLALMLVLIIVLDYTSRVFSIFRTPNGGTLSFVPTIFLLVAIIAKPVQGFLFGTVASIITFFIGSQWFMNPLQFLFDYPIAIGGAIMLGSILYRAFNKLTTKHFMLKVVITMLCINLFQFISYTIALYMYINATSLKGIGHGFISDLIVFMKYNIIYMGPIMAGNVIVSPIIASRIKKFL